ncbi:MAG: hypothetical protein IKR48_11955 [Kiritimatiellae bacterium]|nr:hypothetical protein [Kiritimatiellia bacterium]
MLIDEIRSGETDTLEFKRDVPSDKSLALAFKYMNFIEEWGSGIPRIQEMLSKAGLPPLHIENSGMDIRFTVWRNPVKRAISSEVAQRGAKVAPINRQVAPKPAEVAQRGAKVAPINRQVAPKSAEVAQRGAKVAPINRQVAPKSTEVAQRLSGKGRADAVRNAVAVFECLMANSEVSVPNIESKTHLSNGSVKNAIRLLRQNGIIKRDGSNRSGRWVVLV